MHFICINMSPWQQSPCFFLILTQVLPKPRCKLTLRLTTHFFDNRKISLFFLSLVMDKTKRTLVSPQYGLSQEIHWYYLSLDKRIHLSPDKLILPETGHTEFTWVKACTNFTRVWAYWFYLSSDTLILLETGKTDFIQIWTRLFYLCPDMQSFNLSIGSLVLPESLHTVLHQSCYAWFYLTLNPLTFIWDRTQWFYPSPDTLILSKTEQNDLILVWSHWFCLRPNTLSLLKTKRTDFTWVRARWIDWCPDMQLFNLKPSTLIPDTLFFLSQNKHWFYNCPDTLVFLECGKALILPRNTELTWFWTH